MFNDLFSECPYPIKYFLNNLSEYIIINFDSKLNVIGFNENFIETVDLNQEDIKNLNFHDIFISKNKREVNLKNINQYQKYEFYLSDKVIETRTYSIYECYLFNLNDKGIYLIGKKLELSQKDSINNISKLNNELSNMTRELNKKNLKLKKANKKIMELSQTDKLTGLSNRRYFMEYLEKWISYSKRHSSHLTLIMCDFDNFKDINDNFGHVTGDKVLSTFGELLKSEIRNEDLASRIGGEEFTILLNGTKLKKGINFAKRIRKKLMQLNIESIPKAKNITISMGITEFKKEDNYESFLNRVDKALYKAKNKGKNRVCKL